jgi:hypothetical protein
MRIYTYFYDDFVLGYGCDLILVLIAFIYAYKYVF